MPRFHAADHLDFRPAAWPRRKPKGPVRDFRARGKLKLVQVEVVPAAPVERSQCVLCEGTIDRFDRNTWLMAGRCCGCETDFDD